MRNNNKSIGRTLGVLVYLKTIESFDQNERERLIDASKSQDLIDFGRYLYEKMPVMPAVENLSWEEQTALYEQLQEFILQYPDYIETLDIAAITTSKKKRKNRVQQTLNNVTINTD